MPDPISLSPAAKLPELLSATKNHDKLAKAARDFEALLLSQILKASLGSGESGWFGTDGDDAGAQAVEFAQEQLASALAARGGLGLARMVLSQVSPSTDASDANTANGQQVAKQSIEE